MTAGIQVRCIRPCRNGGRLLAVFDVVLLDAREAAEAVASGRMELVNESDRAAVNRAARDEALRVVRAADRSGPAETRLSWTRRA